MKNNYKFNYKKFFKNFIIISFLWIAIGYWGYYTKMPEINSFANRNNNSYNYNEMVYNEIVYEESQVEFYEAIDVDEIEIQPDYTEITEYIEPVVNITAEEIESLKDFNYLRNNMYIIDSSTNLLESDINVEEFIKMDFKVNKEEEGPKVLIFHTHSQEMYVDSKDKSEGVWGVGERLKELIEENYGVSVLHHNGVYDVVDGKSSILGAYERMEVDINNVLKENPSIEVVIDIHRDGVAENVRLVEEINGKQYAKVMLFNGLTRIYENDVLVPINSLPNEYLKENLALSFNLQLVTNSLYPNFARKIYLNAYRYSLHMKPKSILLEVGAQTNTYEEALNSMELMSVVLGEVLFK